jgi:hypothetical protein
LLLIWDLSHVLVKPSRFLFNKSFLSDEKTARFKRIEFKDIREQKNDEKSVEDRTDGKKYVKIY